MELVERIVKSKYQPEDKTVFWLDMYDSSTPILKSFVNGAWMPVSGESTAPDSVRFTPQELTSAEQAQARQNIHAESHSHIFVGTCTTAAATAEKTVTVEPFSTDSQGKPLLGTVIAVKFNNTNSASNATLNVNETGAASIWYNKSIYTTASEFAGVENRYLYYVWDGTYWAFMSWGTDYDTNTISYLIRTNSSTHPVSDTTGRYRLLFTSADDKKFVPATTSESTDATTVRSVNQRPIDPFGPILYYNGTTVLTQNQTPNKTTLWQQNGLPLGYSFNTAGSAWSMTANDSVYLKCTPQSDGSAIIDSVNPIVFSLPTTDDGKIYIFLGVVSNATIIELTLTHPIYYYKDGAIREWTNPIDAPHKEGYYPDFNAGLANALKGSPISGEFTFRQTGGGASFDNGLAILDKVRGKSLVWNQLMTNNANTGTTAGITYTNNGDGSITIVADGTRTSAFSINPNGSYTVSLINGHKYLLRGCPAGGSVQTYSLRYNSNGFGETGDGAILVCDGTATSGKISISPLIIIQAGVAGTFTFRPQLIDLTLLFGSGYEPATVEEFEALYDLDYYANNAGQIISNKTEAIEVVGFNQWDEVWEVGSIDDTTGSNAETTTTFRSKNYIPVLSNTPYYIKRPDYSSESRIRIFEYDASKNYLGIVYNTNNQVITLDARTRYLRFRTVTAGTTYNHDICINISDPSRNGQYEPYHKTTIPLNIPTITGKLNGEGESVVVFPGGMRSAGSVYDEIVGNKAIVRLAEVDLGDLTWTTPDYQNTTWRTASSGLINTIKAPSSGNDLPNILSSVFRIVTPNQSYLHTYDISISVNTSGSLLIYNTKYADNNYTKEQIKADLSGVKLIYELATPLEYVLDEPITPKTYQVDKDGTERRLPADTASVVSAPFKADIAYPATVQTSPEIFWATYGTTTISEIDAAVTAGKVVMCDRSSVIYALTQHNSGATYYYFQSFVNNSSPYLLVKISDSSWLSGSNVFEKTVDKLTSASSLVTNRTSTTKYPSAKATYDLVYPAMGTTNPSGGLEPNVLYNLGTLTGSVTFNLATPVDATISNHYYWTFDTSSTAPTITWPSGITWVGGSAPVINASKHYEISILNNIGMFLEV